MEHKTFTAFGLQAEADKLQPGLYIVATPIGNLKDISFRALATLAAADVVLAEDTRVSKVLLAHYGISTPLTAYHEHNASVMRPHLLARLKDGATLALVSDAGTPLISDPGFRLVADALDQGTQVFPIPGASAVLAALVVSGLPTDRFFFEGFLPAKEGARRQRINALVNVPGTLVFFESPRRLLESLKDLHLLLGEREAVIARELTKHFETIRRGTLTRLIEELNQEPHLKGELVLLIGPAQEGSEGVSQEDIDTALHEALKIHSVKDAAAIVAAHTGQAKRVVYARALILTQKDA